MTLESARKANETQDIRSWPNGCCGNFSAFFLGLLLRREHQVTGIAGHPMRVFAGPFDIAADGIG